MKGLEATYRFFQTYALPIFQDRFAPYWDQMAVGLVGHGSECFGFDDDVSHDHDFDTSFCIWLPESTFAVIGQELQFAYMHLPHFRASHIAADSGRGVQTIGSFYRRYTGLDGVPATWQQWLSLDTAMLAEATNGQVFVDNLGQFDHIRHTLLTLPSDIRLQKMAAHLILAAQAGQYNVARCFEHGEEGAAVMAIAQFIRHGIEAVFLLAGRYAPYYKWTFRALGQFDLGAKVHPLFTRLSLGPHSLDRLGQDVAIIEQICAVIRDELRAQGLSVAPDDYLVPHAYQVRRHIASDEIRALHIMAGV